MSEETRDITVKAAPLPQGARPRVVSILYSLDGKECVLTMAMEEGGPTPAQTVRILRALIEHLDEGLSFEPEAKG